MQYQVPRAGCPTLPASSAFAQPSCPLQLQLGRSYRGRNLPPPSLLWCYSSWCPPPPPSLRFLCKAGGCPTTPPQSHGDTWSQRVLWEDTGLTHWASCGGAWVRAGPHICVALLAASFSRCFPNKDRQKGWKRLWQWPCRLGRVGRVGVCPALGAH